MPEKLQKLIPLIKVDIAQRLVYGMVTAETEDRDGETCHYETTKPEYKAVNDELGKASGGENIMPLREMHQLNAIGAGKSIEFDDAKKQIKMCFKVVDDGAWKKVLEHVLLGFSQGGRYIKKWKENGKDFYTAKPGEVSLVDNPCLPGAFIEYAKADGTVELFKTPENKLSDTDIEKITKALRASLEKGIKYLVPEGNHLPYTDESGKPSHSHMGAAWAALHGGYRGNKYEGADKEKAIAHLKEIYRQEGMELPSEKAALDEMRKYLESVGVANCDLDTELAKFSTLLSESVRKLDAAIGENMTPEQIKKCAAALGITEAEFTKQFIEGPNFEKAAKGLAALHAHLSAAHEHHAAMLKAHDMMGAMHEKHAAHLAKCMKACKDVMGSDGATADKALKALVDELKATPADDAAAKAAAAKAAAADAAAAGTLTKAQVDEIVAAAVKKAVDALPAPDPVGLRMIPRDSAEKATKTQDSAASPF